MITLVRVDNRLLHGQILEAWVPRLKVDQVVVADGDEETHWYLGTLPGSRYQRVEVQFGHDAPGNFLVNPQSGKVAFVHNGADLVAPSPDGMLLVTWNALNPRRRKSSKEKLKDNPAT